MKLREMFKFKSRALSSIYSEFKNNGYTLLGTVKVDPDFKKLREDIERAYARCTTNNSEDWIFNQGADGLVNLPSHVPEVIDLIDTIVKTELVTAFLTKVLGENYKIWAINLRRSVPGDRGLYLHQDGVCQVNLVVLLDETATRDGATAFLSGSHLIKKSQKRLGLELPEYVVNVFSRLFKPLQGKEGDIFVFTNRIWHGRFQNNSSKKKDVIMVGIFASGFVYNSPWGTQVIDECLRKSKLLDVMATKIDFDSGIVSNCECRDTGNYPKEIGRFFALDIENHEFLKRNSKSWGLKSKLMLFFVLMTLKRLLSSLLILLTLKRKKI